MITPKLYSHDKSKIIGKISFNGGDVNIRFIGRRRTQLNRFFNALIDWKSPKMTVTKYQQKSKNNGRYRNGNIQTSPLPD